MDNRRTDRRRARNAHNGRKPCIGDTVTIDSAAIRAELRDNALSDGERLALLVMIAAGNTTLTVAELKHSIHAAMLEAGGVEAAIARLKR